jgi:hypothetical protein
MSLFFINPTLVSSETFDIGKFFAYTDNYDPLTSDFAYSVINLPIRGNYTVQGQDSRPDLLSAAIYNDVQYYWILMIYNNILDVDTIVTGLTINYPALSDLETLLFTLKADETAALAAVGG